MKKIGILTIDSMNYGNRLQNYAVQVICKRMGYRPSNFRNKSIEKKDIFREMKCLIRDIFKKDKYYNYRQFNKRLIYNNDYVNCDTVSVRNNGYDAIIVGSDQIWNITFDFINCNHFMPINHLKKISFSASFGIESIPFDCEISKSLRSYKAISVRENAGAKIVEEFTGRKAIVLVDPTMLLTKEEWRKIEKKPNKAKEGYILTYFLSPKCEQAVKKLDEIKGERHVYELLDPLDKVAGKAGPAEFLWLFDHADIILTDSFHACVFSFLFGKPFIVYDRNWNEGNMNSRLDTLLSKFSLERKYANSGRANDIWEHDYDEGYKQLEVEREKAMNFLRKALED